MGKLVLALSYLSVNITILVVLVSHYSAIGDTISCNAPYSAIALRGKLFLRYTLLGLSLDCDSCDPSRHLQEYPGPPGPKSQKNVSKKVLWGVGRKVPRNTRKSLKIPKKVRKLVFLDFFGYFLGLFCRPPKRPFWGFFCDFGPGDSYEWRFGSQCDRLFLRKEVGGVAAIVCDTTGNAVRQGSCYTCLAIWGYFGRVTKLVVVVMVIIFFSARCNNHFPRS